jgi:hypothetical protein
MPLTLSRFETGKILSGEASAVSRLYEPAAGCPHQAGTVVILSSTHAGNAGQDTPIARATITGIEKQTVMARKDNANLAIREGFDDARAWYVHLQQLYGEVADTTPIHRLQFRIEEILKK